MCFVKEYQTKEIVPKNSRKRFQKMLLQPKNNNTLFKYMIKILENITID